MIIVENSLKDGQGCLTVHLDEVCITESRSIYWKQYFSESQQWEIFIQCTEAGNKTIQHGYQEHFHHWMAQLKYLDMPKIGIGINEK